MACVMVLYCRYHVELSISDNTDDVVFVVHTAFTRYLGQVGSSSTNFISCSQLQNLNKKSTNFLYVYYMWQLLYANSLLDSNKRTTNYNPVTGIAGSVSSCSCVPQISYLILVHWFTSHHQLLIFPVWFVHRLIDVDLYCVLCVVVLVDFHMSLHIWLSVSHLTCLNRCWYLIIWNWIWSMFYC